MSQETESIKLADEMPLFQNDNTGQKFLNYIFQNLDLSSIKTVENGRIIVQFIVKTDSTISNIKIIKGLNSEIDNAIVKVIENSPKWIPGKKQDKQVNVMLTYPISIDFQ